MSKFAAKEVEDLRRDFGGNGSIREIGGCDCYSDDARVKRRFERMFHKQYDSVLKENKDCRKMKLAKKKEVAAYILEDEWCKDTKERKFVEVMNNKVTGEGNFMDMTKEMGGFGVANRVCRVIIAPNDKFPQYKELFAKEDGSVDRAKVQAFYRNSISVAEIKKRITRRLS